MKEQEFSPFEYDWKWDDTKQVLRVTERKLSAAKWVAEVLEHCNCDREICISSVGRYVYVCDNAGQMAKACCATTDTFNKNTGIAIAYARLRHIPIHSAFKPKTTPKQTLVPIKNDRKVKRGMRVYRPSTIQWGTVMESEPASGAFVPIKWDGHEFGVVVAKDTLLLKVKGES